MDYVKDLHDNKDMFFSFMKEKYPVIVKSNIFFRDIQYAIKSYYEKKNIYVKHEISEEIAIKLIDLLITDGQLDKIDNKSFKVNFLNEI